jgi:peptidoglycan/LPS O-acetylase OafA/YrhL
MAIGIMCYSIYLLHYALLYFITEKFTASFIQNSYYKNLVIQGVIVLPIVIICCSVFYLVIEKPMNKKSNLISYYTTLFMIHSKVNTHKNSHQYYSS